MLKVKIILYLGKLPPLIRILKPSQRPDIRTHAFYCCVYLNSNIIGRHYRVLSLPISNGCGEK